MKITWIVSGTWDQTGMPGSMTLTANSRAEADQLAKSRGLTVLEAMSVGGPNATPAPPPHRRAAAARAAGVEAPAPPRDLPPAPRGAGFAPPRGRPSSQSDGPDASWSATIALAVLLVGVILIFAGTVVARQLDQDEWWGEVLQFVGIVAVLLGLRSLAS